MLTYSVIKLCLPPPPLLHSEHSELIFFCLYDDRLTWFPNFLRPQFGGNTCLGTNVRVRSCNIQVKFIFAKYIYGSLGGLEVNR